jgi:hypothetical protein
MPKNNIIYKLTENENRFAFFKLLCLNLQYIYEFQEKFAGIHHRINTNQFSKFFNEKYKDKMNFLVGEKNKNLFEHLGIFNAFANINTESYYNFYYSQHLKHNSKGSGEFDISYARRYLGEKGKLKESFGITNENPVARNDKVKAFVFGFTPEYHNLCLNNMNSIQERNGMDGSIIFGLADNTYRISFLDFFITQTFAIQTYGVEENNFPGSDILQLFAEESIEDYLAEVKKQDKIVLLPPEQDISSNKSELYDWAMEKGRSILEGRTYKYEKTPMLAFLNRAGNFKFSYTTRERGSFRNIMNVLSSGEGYKKDGLISLTTSREGQINSLTYNIDRIAFEDLFRVSINTERTGNFLKGLTEQDKNSVYKENLDGSSTQNQGMTTEERLTYLLPMLAAQLQTDFLKIDYCKTYELLSEEIEFFRNCTALFNCFMEKHKTSLLLNAI